LPHPDKQNILHKRNNHHQNSVVHILLSLPQTPPIQQRQHARWLAATANNKRQIMKEMKKPSLSFLFASTLVLALAGCATSSRSTAWEYKVATVPGIATQLPQTQEAFLNDLGKQGWILIQTDGYRCYLKRPKE
jgi:hypothetical protein